ncbi:RDD family protein [uncultured Psychroserpens sp.]|uniref:RDD family protein n=1 Tax=uncultured Psychroserpens sp. TaxID=255436 RepID=UPI002613A265|nr:RDD family protein [uncultured Psychroserpens sp.]
MDNTTKKPYASLSTRIKAVFIDAVILILLMYSATLILDAFESVPNYVRTIVFVFLFFLYEPVLVASYGATIGHFFSDIVVKSKTDETKNISFPMAIVRYALKYLLGWLSLLTVSGSENKQAIHDMAANAVVKPYEKLKKQ